MKILLIDNYDSFVYNLYQYFDEEGCEVTVHRNDEVMLSDIDGFDALVLSPGPGIPSNAGLLEEIIAKFKTKPMLGICLGMQAIGEVFGGDLELLEKPLHGFSTEIEHYNHTIFNKVPDSFNVGRYHSWVVNENSLNNKFEILSRDKNGQLMAIKHGDYPMYGFQFHPESVLTDNGRQLITNFLNEVKTCN
jgi:anthranilate synthase component 2